VSEMFINRLRKRARHLRKWARRRGITCYRLYERDMPDQPAIVDWYDGEAVVWTLGRTRDDTPEAAEAWIDDVRESVIQALDLDEDRVFMKRRDRQRGRAQYERLERSRHVKTVEEGRLEFEVNLSDYVDTGLFLDHRVTRGLVRDDAEGRRFLNLFAYTGSFTCYAADGGASRTETVDLSGTYCRWARRNLQLNGFEDVNRHRVTQGDCRGFLDDAVDRRRRFDLIVCDPPTFSASKRMDGVFSVSRDAATLLDRCYRVLTPGGILYFSSNERRFRLPGDDDMPPFEVEDLTAKTIPEDFRNDRIHSCWRMVKPAD